MESTIAARYLQKCKNFQQHINETTEPNELQQLEREYMEYQLDCIPYLEQSKGKNVTIARTKVDLSKVFNKKVDENDEDAVLFRKYMKEIEGTDLNPTYKNLLCTVCTNCGSDDLKKDRETRTICIECGMVVAGCEIDGKPSFKDKDRISICPTTFTYKRENHFNEWLDTIEATGKNDVPNEVLDEVRYELKKQRFTEPSKITAVIVRAILKKLRYNNFYDCIPMIISNVVGRPPLEISLDLRAQLKGMFRSVQKIYKQHAPAHRSNFFSYPYILYKFCELVEADYILPYLTLLKSKEKLYQQDQIFKSICKELNWEFIKTI